MAGYNIGQSPYDSPDTQGAAADPNTAGTINGAYWVGNDGNVYVKGAQGTNAAGKADANTNTYWQSRGYQQIANPGNNVLGDSTTTPHNLNTGGSGSTPAPDLSLYDSNASNLNDLLGRTQTGLDQGLQKNDSEYGLQVANANTDKAKQVQGQNTAKQQTTDKINLNAGQGYNSLAQIIGRAAGTGSSAFRELLPSVIGKDTSSKMQDESNTYGQNLSNIDTSFEGVLQDLANQKKQQEDALRSGVETQRQNINQQLQQNAISRAQAAGQTPTQALAGAQPFQNAITNSRNTVDSFFNQFQPNYTPESLNPNLQEYSADRATINAGQQGASDPNDPYSALLRKKLQGTA